MYRGKRKGEGRKCEEVELQRPVQQKQIPERLNYRLNAKRSEPGPGLAECGGPCPRINSVEARDLFAYVSLSLFSVVCLQYTSIYISLLVLRARIDPRNGQSG